MAQDKQEYHSEKWRNINIIPLREVAQENKEIPFREVAQYNKEIPIREVAQYKHAIQRSGTRGKDIPTREVARGTSPTGTPRKARERHARKDRLTEAATETHNGRAHKRV